MQPKWLKMRWSCGASLFLAVAALANGGCLLAVAGAAGGAAVGYAYYQGKVAQTYQANFNDTWSATHTALIELGMPVLSEEHKEVDSGFMESRTSDGTKVRIYLDSFPSKIQAEGTLTRVGIRVATFGDHQVSDRILYQIGAHLVPNPAAGPPIPPPPQGWSQTRTGSPAAAGSQSGEPPLSPASAKAPNSAPPTSPALLPPQPVRQ